jgi:amidophosphoribosyltransferase
MAWPSGSSSWNGPRHECGIAAVYALDGGLPDWNRDIAFYLPRMLLDMQMRGELSSGMSVYNPNRKRFIETHRELGTVNQAFRLRSPKKVKSILNRCSGPAGIAHTRYATSGPEEIEYAQPFERYHGRSSKWFTFGFNGNLANYQHLRRLLEVERGYHTLYGTDTEIILHFLSRELRGEEKPRPEQIFYRLSVEFDGCYNIVFLNADGDLLVARDPVGFRPLCWASDDKLFAAASESVALWNLGFKEIHSLDPGSLIHVGPRGIAHRRFAEYIIKKRCFFEWVYFSNVASIFDGRSVYAVRNALGKMLADLEPLTPDENTIVVPVPDSAKAAADAMGYYLGVPVIEGIIRNRYVGRSFIKGENRSDTVMQKYTPVAGALSGKRVILVDDSIVRGNTVRRLIRDLKSRGGACEIHLRVTCPPITRPCFYGIDMSTMSELFAPHFMDAPPTDVANPELLDNMAATMGADSLLYAPISKIPECIGFPEEELCMACVTGDYPTPGGKQMFDLAMENKAKGITGRTSGT